MAGKTNLLIKLYALELGVGLAKLGFSLGRTGIRLPIFPELYIRFVSVLRGKRFNANK